jgi:DNA-binding response OmpR family regulator
VRTLRHKVLVVDDDPSHLEIYGLLLRQAGYEPVSALVRYSGAELPAESNIDCIILDYRLRSRKTSADLARQIRSRYPSAPIVLLSDLWNLPSDVAPYVTDFVRRGEPAELLDRLSHLLPQAKDRHAKPSLTARLPQTPIVH